MVYKHCRSIWLPRYITSSSYLADLRQLLVTGMASFTVKRTFSKVLFGTTHDWWPCSVLYLWEDPFVILKQFYLFFNNKVLLLNQRGWIFQCSCSSAWDGASLFGYVVPAISIYIVLPSILPDFLHEAKDALSGARNEFERLWDCRLKNKQQQQEKKSLFLM